YYSGDVRVVSGWCGGSTRTLVGCVLVSLTLVTPALGETLLRTLDDPLNFNGGGFGGALVEVGPQLALGAPGTPVLDRDGAGVVHLYGPDGVLRRTIEAFDPAADAGFGTKLAAADGILYLGAPGDPPTGVGAMGAVYVFDATTGVLLRTLRAPGENTATAPLAAGP